MGADNWAICPQCLKTERERLHAVAEAKREEANRAYGRLVVDEYMTLERAAREAEEAEMLGPPRDTTLREDYEVLTDECGDFFISYLCSCSKCDLRFSFKHEQNVLAAPVPDGRGGEA